MSVKIQYHDTVRRIAFDVHPDEPYERFVRLVHTSFPSLKSFELRWIDPEHDECTIASDLEIIEVNAFIVYFFHSFHDADCESLILVFVSGDQHLYVDAGASQGLRPC